MTPRSSARTRAGRARSRTAGAVLAAGVLVGSLAGCGGSSSEDAVPGPTTGSPTTVPSDLPQHAALLLQRDDAGGIAQRGTADVTVSWSRIDNGRAEPVAGPQGTLAWDMPAFTTAPSYPRAAMVVRNASDQDSFSPGTQDFMWGADFQLDAVSTAHTGPDNGDNLLQRGLWGQSAEYKAEVDLRRASCAVHGTEGTLLVRAKMQAQPGTWYRMRCYREPDALTVTVRELLDDGWGPITKARVNGPVGAVDYPASMPISIGGKIAPNGVLIKSATDQFNGRIANPVIEIGSTS